MQDLGIFQQILDALQQALAPGAQNVRQQLLFWWGMFLWFETFRAIYGFLWNGDLLERVANTLIKGGLVYWALYNFPMILEETQRLFIYLGLLAGSNRLTIAQFLDPGEYLRLGLRVNALLEQTMYASFGLTSLGQAISYAFLWFCFMAAFGFMACNIFLWQVELLIAAVMLLMVLPCAAFRSLAWISQGAIAYIVNKTFRFGVGALVVSLTFPLLERLTVTRPVSFQSTLVGVIGGWMFAGLFFVVNKMASGFLSGMPQLSASTLISNLVGTAMAGGSLVTAGTGLGAAGVGAGAALARGGVLAAGGARGMLSASQTAMMAQGIGPRLAGTLAGGYHGMQQAAQGSLAQRLGRLQTGGLTQGLGGSRQSLSRLGQVGRTLGQDGGGHGARP